MPNVIVPTRQVDREKLRINRRREHPRIELTAADARQPIGINGGRPHEGDSGIVQRWVLEIGGHTNLRHVDGRGDRRGHLISAKCCRGCEEDRGRTRSLRTRSPGLREITIDAGGIQAVIRPAADMNQPVIDVNRSHTQCSASNRGGHALGDFLVGLSGIEGNDRCGRRRSIRVIRIKQERLIVGAVAEDEGIPIFQPPANPRNRQARRQASIQRVGRRAA